ncbi:MAG: RNA methyltransferase [Lachnospiraceae bacterium]|nr:RNA methyltransferase [Lachnospiraceae bacterium]
MAAKLQETSISSGRDSAHEEISYKDPAVKGSSSKGLSAKGLSAKGLSAKGLSADNDHAKYYEACCLELRKHGYTTVTDDVMKSMSDTQTPQGILCVVKQPSCVIEDIMGNKKSHLLLILEGLQDPGNLGTIFRTSEAAGVTGIIMSRDTVDIYNPKTIRSTMGSIYRVPFIYSEDLYTDLDKLRAHGISVYAAYLTGSVSYDKCDYRSDTAFLIGNEGNGLSDKALSHSDTRVRIPMEGSVESLNAAVSAAVLMYEAHRQRSL